MDDDSRLLPKVIAGNACARAAAKIARMCLRCGVPFAVENPRASWLWKLPVWRGIVDDPRTTLCCCDQCMYGAPWRKRTGLLCGNIPTESLAKLDKRCNGSRGCCDRTGRQHILLIGTDGHGVCWTKRAQSYPLKLAQAIANCLIENVREELLLKNSNFAGRVACFFVAPGALPFQKGPVSPPSETYFCLDTCTFERRCFWMGRLLDGRRHWEPYLFRKDQCCRRLVFLLALRHPVAL